MFLIDSKYTNLLQHIHQLIVANIAYQLFLFHYAL